MKKLILLSLAILFTSLTACDMKNENDQFTTNSGYDSSEFLKSYFTGNFSEGKSIVLNSNKMKVFEVIGDTQITPIGYVVTNLDMSEFLYFVEVNVKKNTLTSIDFKNGNETVLYPLSKFIKHQNIENIDNFNFLDEIKKEDSISNERKFWGWDCGPSWTTGTGDCFQTCCHRIFWIGNGCDVFGCGVH